MKVLLVNLRQENFSIQRGIRIAQTVIAPVVQVNVCVIDPNQKEASQDKIRSRCAKKTAGSAGLDLCAALNEEESIVLTPGQRAFIATGLIFHFLAGFEENTKRVVQQVTPKSHT